MKKTLLLTLILFITIQVNAQQFTNKFLNDTLDMYTHWGIIRVIDTVYNDTTIFGINVNSQGSIDLIIADTAVGGETGVYSYVSHATNALTGDLIGVHGNARVNVASAAGNVYGGKFQAGNYSAGYNMMGVRGIYIDVVNKIPSASTATWATGRGVEVSMDLDQGSAGHTNTVTDAQAFYACFNLPTAGTYATVTNGYGVFIRNEAVGGTGQILDAGFYLDDRNHSPGVYGWDYGIDFSGIGSNSGKFGTADIRLANGALISNPDEDSLIITEKYTRFIDDVIIDSTLFVKVVNYAEIMGYFSQYTVTTGSYNAQTGLNIDGSLIINEWNLDSIIVDSIRILTYSSGDSIAFYRMELMFHEIGGASYAEAEVIFSTDSINYATGETGYKTGTIAATSGRTVEAPFVTYIYEPYWHNRSGASITWRNFQWITYLRAFYSK